MNVFADDIRLAGELVRAAGELAARMLGDGLSTERKTSVSDVVSAADRAAEDLIAARLRSERPADGLVGEEGTNTPGVRTWHIDPVDGTYNFLAGVPFWCSAVSLSDADGQIVGAVYQPSTDELWLGGRDLPTTCNGAPVPGVIDRPLAEISVASYLHPPRLGDDGLRVPLLRAVGGAATVRMFGSGSVELASVASGRVGAWLQPDSADWDWLPGAALVRAAGGETAVLDAHGHRWHLAGGRRAVEELERLIRLA